MNSGAGPDLNELYREHPSGFVASRKRVAKELRDAGDREAEDRLKKLPRPTAAAWLLNRAALTAPKLLEEFAEASRGLEEAQRRALEGEDEGAAEWRAAANRERDAAAAVLEAAEQGGREAGHPASSQALDLVDKTLRAATADADLRDRVVRGRLEREQSAATIGAPATAVARRRAPDSAKRRDAAQARRELKRLERELAAAAAREERLRARVDEAAEALREESARLTEGKRETAELRRRLKAAERRSRTADRR